MLRLTDEDVEELKARGYSEDEIFEITIAAALWRRVGPYGEGARSSERRRRVRLGVLKKGGPLQVRATRKLLGFTNGPPAVVVSRPEFFGRRFGAGVRRALEGSAEEWSRGEMELFAAFVSDVNRCKY